MKLRKDADMSSPVLIPQSPCLTIHDFFQKSYGVPEFQRGYAWKEEHVKALLDDIHDFLETDSPIYLLGQVIVAYSKSDDDYILVDGQQRTTTLLLLLIVLHKCFLRIPNIHTNVGLNFMASRLGALTMRASSGGNLRASVTVSEDGAAIIEALIQGKEPPHARSWTQENILNAYNTIVDYFDEYWNDVGAIPDLYNKIVNRVYIVRLELPNIEMAVDTFEKINNRGLGLSSSDLIKNIIFQLVNDVDYQEQVSVNWSKTSEILYGCRTSRLRNIEYLLRAMILAKSGALISSRQMRNRWRDDLTSEKQAIDFASSLPAQANYLRNIDFGKTPVGNDIRILQGSQYFGTVQHFPILLAAAHLQPTQFEMVAKIVEDRTIISLLAKERPQDYEKLVPSWGHALSKLTPAATIDEIRAACGSAFIDIRLLLEVVKVNILGLRAKNNTEKKRLRYILARISRKVMFDAAIPAVPELEAILKTNRTTKAKSVIGYDIEHIRPSSIYQDSDLTDSIGNLVLAHPNDNRSVGNDAPIIKIDVYRTSNLLLTQSLCSIEQLAINNSAKQVVRRIHEIAPPYLHDWNDQAILNRTELYWQIFLSDLSIHA
jgi:hypothetical protein